MGVVQYYKVACCYVRTRQIRYANQPPGNAPCASRTTTYLPTDMQLAVWFSSNARRNPVSHTCPPASQLGAWSGQLCHACAYRCGMPHVTGSHSGECAAARVGLTAVVVLQLCELDESVGAEMVAEILNCIAKVAALPPGAAA